jgi:hypothetical protein
MGNCDERMKAIQYLCSDGAVHEKFWLLRDGISEIRAQREEKTDRIRWTITNASWAAANPMNG